MTSTSRRQFNQLLLASFTGMMAGTISGCSRGKQDKPAEDKKSGDGNKTAGDDKSARGGETPAAAAAKAYDEDLLLAGDPHVCRGLNQCKNQGKSKMNECAGQGDCATAEKHGCDGLNVCKGQGGCGEHPGQNRCKGQGACEVPLTNKTWKKARDKFEELMAKKKQDVGAAPAKG